MVGASFELVFANENDNLHTGNPLKDDNSSITLDSTLSYLSNILMEESIDEEDVSFKQGKALQAMEELFSDIIGQKPPPARDSSQSNYNTQPQRISNSTTEPLEEHSNSTFRNIPALEYNKGLEEGMKFIPSIENLMLDFQGGKLSFPSPNEAENEDGGRVIKGSNGKKKLDSESLDLLERRNTKIPLAYSEEPVRDAKLDEVILYRDNDYFKKVASLRETMKESTSNGKEVPKHYTDFNDLLIHCSHSIASNDHHAAREIIKEVKKRAMPDGDWNQRLALVLANALEARLAGIGIEIYNQCTAKRISTSETVKVHYLLMTVTPFMRGTYGIAFGTIVRSVGTARKLHIIDFGIDFGFQWPSLIQELSERKGGSVKLKITGIDFPRSGFRPSERVDETGRRLEEYARSFGVPFEYHGIASKWEDISIKDLKIENDELLIVNSMYRFRQLGDEAIALDCPRNRVLNLIQRLKPHLFLHGVDNRAFGPYFLTRFKQVMLHYGSMFDILDAFVPRDNTVRHLIESNILAPEVINLVACEGPALVEKPETYKQWHLRHLRAGFEQVPVEPAIIQMCKKKYKEIHDKRYFIEEENHWVLQGWRGKPMFAISIWKPKETL